VHEEQDTLAASVRNLNGTAATTNTEAFPEPLTVG